MQDNILDMECNLSQRMQSFHAVVTKNNIKYKIDDWLITLSYIIVGPVLYPLHIASNGYSILYACIKSNCQGRLCKNDSLAVNIHSNMWTPNANPHQGSGDFWAQPAKICPFTTSTGFFRIWPLANLLPLIWTGQYPLSIYIFILFYIFFKCRLISSSFNSNVPLKYTPV